MLLGSPGHRPRGLALLLAAFCCAGLAVGAAPALALCPGDVDGSGAVTAVDLEVLQPLVFSEEGEGVFPASADANQDGGLSAADVVAAVLWVGRACPLASPSRSPTPTPTPSLRATVSPGGPTATPTRTATATRTFTPSASPTPTAVCTVRSLSPGQSIEASLTTADCTRLINGTVRFVDAYEIVPVPGSSLRVTVTSTAVLKPWIVVIDPNGQFSVGSGSPPVEWTAVSGKPYVMYVTSDPSQAQQLGSYRVGLTSRPCPTPRAIRLSSGFALSNLVLGSNDCPDPAGFFSGGTFDPVHTYTFEVTSVPTQVSITMRQLIEDDPLDPYFVVIGPDGVEVVPSEQVDDAGGGSLDTDAAGRFLIIRPGTYTMYAGGGMGRYSLIVTAPSCAVRALANIPADRPLVCPGQGGPGCQGTLSGNRSLGTCGGPLPVVLTDDAPSINSGANLYSITAQAGDIVSVGLDVDGDDGYALLLGPSSAGNPLVGYASSFLSEDGMTQLGATVARAGTYLLSLGNVSALAPPDPSIEDPGDEYPYRFFLQKCPVAGVLNVDGAAVQSRFVLTDCLGSGGVPMQNYSLAGRAGQLVVVELSGDAALDPYLRLWGPDQSGSENDNDPFVPDEAAARVFRILPSDGIYFVEASTSPGNGTFDPQASNAFRLRARSCATRPISPGLVSSSFGAEDCRLSDGRPYEVFTLEHDGSSPAVASFSVGDNVCLLALLPNGETIPRASCAENFLEVPLVRAGTYGLVVANDRNVSEPYTFLYRRCPVGQVSYADRVAGNLTSLTCMAADGVRADWFWISAPQALVQFNDGFGGLIESLFRARVGLVDGNGFTEWDRAFATDSGSMLRLVPDRLGALLRVRGSNGNGPYVLAVDPAFKRQ